jgi:hypothetical protein
MSSLKNKRGLTLDLNSPGRPFLAKKGPIEVINKVVALPPPAKKGPPPLYPIHTYYTHPLSEKTQELPIKFGDNYPYKVLPELPYAAISFNVNLIPNMYYVSSTTNGAFPFSFDELVVVEKQRLDTINASRARARGGKSRRSRHPKKHHKRTIRRRM